MARPPRYDQDRLLDAAVELAGTAGPPAVTMAAVAKAAGAPSGSVYHRFPSRPALLAALWLRTVERFQEGWLAALAAGDPAAASRHVIAWSRAHRREAAILQYGPHDYAQPDWPAPDRQRAEQGNRRVREALETLAGALGATAHLDQVTLAVIDLPLAIVRRPLRTGDPIPPGAESLAERGTRALLADLSLLFSEISI